MKREGMQNPRTCREEIGGVQEGGRKRGRGQERGRERERESTLAPAFICFSLDLGLPYANWV